nr:hypothetical protein GCM10020185_57160 [Pseudomonas brassicacearum subsp. brassicacearum]
MRPGSGDGFGLDVLPGGDRDVGDPPALAPDLAFGIGVAKLPGAQVIQGKKSMIFGMPGVPVAINRCTAAASSMKPAMTPPWMAGSKGLPMLSLLAGRRNNKSSPWRVHWTPMSWA